MLDNEPTGSEQIAAQPAADAGESTTTGRTRTTRRRTTKAAAQPAAAPNESAAEAVAGGEAAPVKATRRRRRAAEPEETGVSTQDTSVSTQGAQEGQEGTQAPASRTRRRKATPTAATATSAAPAADEAAQEVSGKRRRSRASAEPSSADAAPIEEPPASKRRAPAATVLFMAPETPAEPAAARAAEAPATRAAERATARAAEPEVAVAEEAPETGKARSRRRGRRTAEPEAPVEPAAAEAEEAEEAAAEDEDEYEIVGGKRRRRRGRRGRGRGRGTHDEAEEAEEAAAAAVPPAEEAEEEAEAGETLTRRRRRRRRGASAGESAETAEDGVVTVVKVRQPRAARDEVQGVSGSTRLEAKRQRRRDGREQRRTRPPILSESEFLARREAVDRSMVIREKGDRTQIAVLEDGVLVEHYVTRASAGSMVGNVYLGKVQNVLPSMEAAFVDIGRGRNAVLYAGEVNWDATGLEGRARSIEQALKSGDSVLVQVTKDPIGHKGARLTSHIALSGRHLVYVPHGNASGISRKLPDNERRRLRDILKSLIPDSAGVIVRTAAEGATADELERDVTRLQAQWEDIQAKAAEGGAPVLLYEEPDLVIRVVRDLFNEDFRELDIQGAESNEMVEMYLKHVSPDLVPRLRRHAGPKDVFAERRIDEQILKGLDRKVYLPSGGSLVIDRTEAMTVIDVNTGKYTGTGGNLEETVTRNNLEAAEEIVRQLRLRDLGGIIVIDFIDMVLESNRELVLRRLTECLGRDRTKHQVTEITSLGLVQMTRKRIGQGLLEAFSETCEHCKGRGVVIHTEPVAERRQPAKAAPEPAPTTSGRRRGRKAAAQPVPEEQETPGVNGARPGTHATGEPEEIELAAPDEVTTAPDEAEDVADEVLARAGAGDLGDEDLLDTIEEDDAEESGDEATEAEFEPIERVSAGDNGHFRASADDPDAIEAADTSEAPRDRGAVAGGRRRVIWASRRRSRP